MGMHCSSAEKALTDKGEGETRVSLDTSAGRTTTWASAAIGGRAHKGPVEAEKLRLPSTRFPGLFSLYLILCPFVLFADGGKLKMRTQPYGKHQNPFPSTVDRPHPRGVGELGAVHLPPRPRQQQPELLQGPRLALVRARHDGDVGAGARAPAAHEAGGADEGAEDGGRGRGGRGAVVGVETGDARLALFFCLLPRGDRSVFCGLSMVSGRKGESGED